MGNCVRRANSGYDQPRRLSNAQKEMMPQMHHGVSVTTFGAPDIILSGPTDDNSFPNVSQDGMNHAKNRRYSISSNHSQNALTILVALYSYESRVEEDLSFAKGDTMILVDESNPDWWYVRHTKTKEMGYVPRNFVGRQQVVGNDEWYAGKVARDQAEKLILQAKLPPGTFLVRERENCEGEYALTVRVLDKNRRDIVKHYKIKRTDSGSFYICTKKTFVTLHELVCYYTATADGLCCTLTFPVPRIAPLPTICEATQKDWEIPRSQLKLQRKLGSGNFGEVWYGSWRGVVEVAVKVLRGNNMSAEGFLAEAGIMKQCDHPNLVKLYAVCSKEAPLYIVTEFMSNGSLLDFLRRPNAKHVVLRTYIRICSQIASGMSYLEERRMVHRDLATRNILVGESVSGVPVVKVADFGLARLLMEDDIYEARTGAKFPIKWTAPEAALAGNFTVKSDVWSFGIVLLEIFTRGQIPYPGMDNRTVIEEVRKGYRSPRPKACPSLVYEQMLVYWSEDPGLRPDFQSISRFFDNFPFTSPMPVGRKITKADQLDSNRLMPREYSLFPRSVSI